MATKWAAAGVPLKLERLLALGILICADEFLSVFTLLPLRVAAAVAALMVAASVIKLYVVFNVMEIFDRLCCSFGVDVLDSLGWTAASAVSFHLADAPPPPPALADLSVVGGGGGGVHFAPRSPMPVRPTGAGGAPVASPMRRPTPAHDVHSVSPAARSRSTPPLAGRRHRAWRGVGLAARFGVDYALALVYLHVHALLLLTWVVTLNVAINTANSALLTLLISNNFVELKGSVFKAYKVPHLFQISCADAVERFQLSVFLGSMLVYTQGDGRLLRVWAIMGACECVVDWVKHAFVAKFNRVPHNVYRHFSLVLSSDLLAGESAGGGVPLPPPPLRAEASSPPVRALTDGLRAAAGFGRVGGSAAAKRTGFVALPLAALAVRMVGRFVVGAPPAAAFAAWVAAIAVKLAVSTALAGHAARRLRAYAERRGEWAGHDDRNQQDWFHTLSQLKCVAETVVEQQYMIGEICISTPTIG
ncbi:hypothetical protein I4F81_005725 [Pyropia yezoensis]|uniref:Uncharacterized protein n=1 Tax=Pyropia yezoensis TaxID=2788 RepID=A0ACC3C051_PYRYE|nr:hypothetical protein I4F81_005725 [Neopyropia yezoensis]